MPVVVVVMVVDLLDLGYQWFAMVITDTLERFLGLCGLRVPTMFRRSMGGGWLMFPMPLGLCFAALTWVPMLVQFVQVFSYSCYWAMMSKNDMPPDAVVDFELCYDVK
ncbi:hypothetical protein QVD17_18851 [Tagetes erecta]|uniref:Uncharacterized protein n=1 Tax=Tagetes erecta TaxID=13708 RepID=A0AAD8KID7_TARER|nr:hypothetical protein QVD17_18851 [Tagetes erecta]